MARHFGERAERYDQEAFLDGAGLAAISDRELSIVRNRLGQVEATRILDIGIGTGRFAKMLHEFGAKVYGLDVTPEMLAACRSEAPYARLVLGRLGSRLPFRNASFDAVLCIRVLKYLDSWDGALGELRRVLRPGGRFVVEITNRRSIARWGYPGMPIHLATLPEVRQLLQAAGFGIHSVDRVARLPFPIYRWANTPFRQRPLQQIEHLADRTLGPTSLARSFILTCHSESGYISASSLSLSRVLPIEQP